MSVPQTGPVVPKNEPATDHHAPRQLTLGENVALTLKLLGGVGLIGVALWAVNLWTATQ